MKSIIQKELEKKGYEICKEQKPYSFKQVFYPSEEKILDFEGKKIKENFDTKKRAIFAARFHDLKALALYDEVFKKDVFYQKRRANLFVFGADDKQDSEELKYIPFDIFLNGKEVLSGTTAGSKLLAKLKIKHKNITQLGNSSPKDKKEAKAMNELFKKLDNHKIWKELGEICIACGKCSIVCPTCFCFDFDDEISPTKFCRNRIWGSCFYQDFTKIAGGYIFKDKVADRIKFWYMHKFLRIPKEYGMLGCVKCGRCADVCPVEIDIKANIKRLKKVSGSVE